MKREHKDRKCKQLSVMEGEDKETAKAKTIVRQEKMDWRGGKARRKYPKDKRANKYT